MGNAIECIYRDLEYARSLLPPLKTASTAPTPIPHSPNPSSAKLPSVLPITTSTISSTSRDEEGGERSTASSPRATRGGADSKDHSSDESSGWDVLGNSGVLSNRSGLSSFGDE